MKFKVKAKTTETISVEYEDGSHAVVPIFKGQTKEQIIGAVQSFVNDNSFDSVSDVPVDVSEDWLDSTAESDPDVDYRFARQSHYPDMGRQFDALYWQRVGDDTQQKKIDEEIKLVKDTIPKGKTYKYSEVPKLLD